MDLFPLTYELLPFNFTPRGFDQYMFFFTALLNIKSNFLDGISLRLFLMSSWLKFVRRIFLKINPDLNVKSGIKKVSERNQILYWLWFFGAKFDKQNYFYFDEYFIFEILFKGWNISAIIIKFVNFWSILKILFLNLNLQILKGGIKKLYIANSSSLN